VSISIRSRLCLFTLPILAIFAVAMASAQGAHKLPVIKFEKYTLPNGLTSSTCKAPAPPT
jgi:hypothetical protein